MCKQLSILLFFLILSVSLKAQRVSYPELFYRTQMPTIFIDDHILPGDSSQSILLFTFRFNYDFLPFKKIPFQHDLNAPEDAKFFTSIHLNSEIFRGSTKKRDEAEMQSVNRDMWADTLFTKTFEETQSDDNYASGSLSTPLEPGMYNYILQLQLMQDQNERNTKRQNIHVPDLENKQTGESYLVRSSDMGAAPVLELMNMRDNVPFGENFYVLMRIPDYEDSVAYTLNIHEAEISKKDTSARKEILNLPIEDKNIFNNATLRLQPGDQPKLKLLSGGHRFTYLFIQIPNETFENASYLMFLKKKGDNKPLVEQFFKSYWPDMPASLFNLDIAIDMLKFIISKDELKNLRSGNSNEKERKFRAFWSSKDPTPNTIYNELMAEYYRRIDYAFKEFRSPENPMGHDSDQGEVYIKFGPPDSIQRVYPTDDRVREIWTYPTRTFVFETTSGFGDFVLIGTK